MYNHQKMCVCANELLDIPPGRRVFDSAAANISEQVVISGYANRGDMLHRALNLGDENVYKYCLDPRERVEYIFLRMITP